MLLGNSRPRVTTTPLPHATGAYGQLPGRDFNPLDLLLLLRTVKAYATELGVSLGQEGTAGKGHELAAIKSLLDTLVY